MLVIGKYDNDSTGTGTYTATEFWNTYKSVSSFDSGFLTDDGLPTDARVYILHFTGDWGEG